MDDNQCNKERLFIALIPPEDIQLKIHDFVSKIEIEPEYIDKIKSIPWQNYHITLQFLGDFEAGLVSDLIQLLQNIKLKSFKLKLNTIGYFKRSHVLWLGVKEKPEDIDYLVDACFYNIYNSSKFNHNINRNNSKDSSFTPHITLFKRINNLKYIANLSQLKTSKSLKPNIDWNIDCFYLVRSILSEHVVEYQIVAKF